MGTVFIVLDGGSEYLRLQAKDDRWNVMAADEMFSPLPPGDAATQWRVRDSGISGIAFPSSPALLPEGEGSFFSRLPADNR